MSWLCLICETINNNQKRDIYKRDIYKRDICKFCCTEKNLYINHFDTCLNLNANIDKVLPRHEFDIFISSEKLAKIELGITSGSPYLDKESTVKYIISRLKYRTQKSHNLWRRKVINRQYLNMILNEINNNLLNINRNERLPKKLILQYLL